MSFNWQPIRTAPKDGTRILIFEAHLGTAGIVRVSYWRDDTIPRGWVGAENAPSYWLPLPLPPTSQSLAYDTHAAKIFSMLEACRNARDGPSPSQTKKE
jgi:hypothetical protein